MGIEGRRYSTTKKIASGALATALVAGCTSNGERPTFPSSSLTKSEDSQTPTPTSSGIDANSAHNPEGVNLVTFVHTQSRGRERGSVAAVVCFEKDANTQGFLRIMANDNTKNSKTWRIEEIAQIKSIKSKDEKKNCTSRRSEVEVKKNDNIIFYIGTADTPDDSANNVSAYDINIRKNKATVTSFPGGSVPTNVIVNPRA